MVGNGKWEGAPCPAEPSPPPAPLPSYLLPNVLFQGVWLTLGAVIAIRALAGAPCPQQVLVPSPIPSPTVLEPAGHRGSPARGGLISHTRSVNPDLFGVPYSLLCPLSMSHPWCCPQPGHVTSLLSVPIPWFAVWIVALGGRCRFSQPCGAFLSAMSCGHRF